MLTFISLSLQSHMPSRSPLAFTGLVGFAERVRAVNSGQVKTKRDWDSLSASLPSHFVSHPGSFAEPKYFPSDGGSVSNSDSGPATGVRWLDPWVVQSRRGEESLLPNLGLAKPVL